MSRPTNEQREKKIAMEFTGKLDARLFDIIFFPFNLLLFSDEINEYKVQLLKHYKQLPDYLQFLYEAAEIRAKYLKYELGVIKQRTELYKNEIARLKQFSG